MAKTDKEKAQVFLMLSALGKSGEAFNLYEGEGFRHHNIYFKGDAETLIKDGIGILNYCHTLGV